MASNLKALLAAAILTLVIPLAQAATPTSPTKVPVTPAKAAATGPAGSADIKGTDTEAADLSRIERYLNNLRTMSARFMQSTTDGGEAQGAFYVARPGKLRVEYDPPNKILIVSDGSQIHYYDSELGQVSTISLSDTPAAVLVRDNYKFGTDVRVSDYQKGPGAIRVTLEDIKNADAGALTLTFQDNPLILKQWKVLDAKGVETTVALSDTKRDVVLAPTLFEFTDPTKGQAPFGNN